MFLDTFYIDLLSQFKYIVNLEITKNVGCLKLQMIYIKEHKIFSILDSWGDIPNTYVWIPSLPESNTNWENFFVKLISNLSLQELPVKAIMTTIFT